MINYKATVKYLSDVLESKGYHKSANIHISDTGSVNYDSGYVIEIKNDNITISSANTVDEAELKVQIHVAIAKALQTYHETQLQLLESLVTIRNILRNTEFSILSSLGVSYINASDIDIKIQDNGNAVGTLEVTITY